MPTPARPDQPTRPGALTRAPSAPAACGLAAVLVAAALLASAGPGAAATPVPPATAVPFTDSLPLAERSRALARASDAVVAVRTLAVEDARTARTLGRQREGSGILVGDDGLVLTVGYLLLEAEHVVLQTDDGLAVPARVLGQDPFSGLGLVQALVPLRRAPVPLGDLAVTGAPEALTVASGGIDAAVSPVQLLSRRAFSATWEYHLDSALYTAPARRDHSGAGLFNARGELVGVGSLLLADAAGDTAPRQAGNLFVPASLARSMLQQYRDHGRIDPPQRPWMGLNCLEQDGQVRVLRVTDDSPADVAGLQAGDHILRIDGVAVDGLARLWTTLWATPESERPVVLEVQRGDARWALTVHTVDRSKTLRRASAI